MKEFFYHVSGKAMNPLVPYKNHLLMTDGAYIKMVFPGQIVEEEPVISNSNPKFLPEKIVKKKMQAQFL